MTFQPQEVDGKATQKRSSRGEEAGGRAKSTKTITRTFRWGNTSKETEEMLVLTSNYRN